MTPGLARMLRGGWRNIRARRLVLRMGGAEAAGRAMAEPAPDLVRAAQQGNPEALSELVRQQQQYVYSVAMNVLRNPADAADVTQEAFIRLFRALPSYRGETRFTTWLYRLVVNLCFDELRRRKPQDSLDAAVDADSETPAAALPDDDPLVDPESVAQRAELSREIRAALDQLEPAQRLALTLYYFNELKYEEIAAVTNWPLNTVKSHIRRGKQRLAHVLRVAASESLTVSPGTG